ncbi:MAG: Wzz/FepE/Etk N-terminal domain-containing protein [Cyclobacteriaceae bacterium]
MAEQRQNREILEDEIDLIELIKVIWSKRWSLMKVTGVCFAFGVIIALTSPKEYEVTCTLIPEAVGGEGKLGGSLGGLASLAGIDLGGLSGGGSTINPGLYRSVAQSTPFLHNLMKERFFFQELNREVSLYDYYIEHQSAGLLSKILFVPFQVVRWIKSKFQQETASPRPSKIISLTKDEQKCADDLRDRILVTMDWELNVVTIQVKLQDPVVAAEVGNFTQEFITRYVTNYAVSKSHEQLKFVQSQFERRKQEFEDIQLDLAKFRDQNQYVNTAKARSEEERLQSRYNLAFNIYNQLAQQVETIQLQINENTPVFTELEPVAIPPKNSEPKVILILFIAGLIGVISGVSWVLITEYFGNLKL